MEQKQVLLLQVNSKKGSGVESNVITIGRIQEWSRVESSVITIGRIQEWSEVESSVNTITQNPGME